MSIFSKKSKINTTLCHVATLNEQGKRPSQQDALAVINEDNSRFFAAVADGMGGMSHGKDAAQISVDSFTSGARTIENSCETSAVLERLTISVNERIHEQFDGTSGTTLAAVMILDDQLYWVSVGDSAIFLNREGQLIQLNHEHSYKMLLKRGAIFDGDLGEMPKLSGSDGHRLTAYIGSKELLDIDRNLYGFLLMPGDKLLLCTDGVTRTIDELTMAVILKNPPEKAVRIIDGLIKHKALAKQDNYTAIVAQVIFNAEDNL